MPRIQHKKSTHLNDQVARAIKIVLTTMRIANDVSKKGPLQKKTSAGNPETVDFEELPGENKGMVWNKLCVFSGL